MAETFYQDGLILTIHHLFFHAQRYISKSSNGSLIEREAHDEFLWNIYGAYLERKRFGASHCYMYDWPTLHILLREVGFSQIIRQGYQVSLDRELTSLDNRPEDSLHIDAVK